MGIGYCNRCERYGGHDTNCPTVVGEPGEQQLRSRIEQLTARVRELEEENAHLKKSRENFAVHAEQTLQQLAASQLHAEQLREALDVVSIAPLVNDCGLPKYGVSVSEMKLVQKALAIPHDTSALDAYVSEKVKEAMK